MSKVKKKVKKQSNGKARIFKRKKWEMKEKLDKRKTVYEVNSRRTRDRVEKKQGASLFSN